MRVFLSGASAELSRCTLAMDDIRELGPAFTITFDWCQHIRDARAAAADGCLTDVLFSEQTLNEAANRNIAGIRMASIFIVLAPAPTNSSTGCWFELGYAVSNRNEREMRAREPGMGYHNPLRVLWVGPRRGPFWTMADTVFATWAECLKSLGT